MLPKIAFVTDAPDTGQSAERRSARRKTIKFGFETDPNEGVSPLLILDISQTGFLFQTSEKMAVDETVSIQLPEAGLVEARIVRQSNDLFGARFINPISAAAVSATLLAAPVSDITGPVSIVDLSYERENCKKEYYFWLTMTIMVAAAIVIAAFVMVIALLPVSGWVE